MAIINWKQLLSMPHIEYSCDCGNNSICDVRAEVFRAAETLEDSVDYCKYHNELRPGFGDALHNFYKATSNKDLLNKINYLLNSNNIQLAYCDKCNSPIIVDIDGNFVDYYNNYNPNKLAAVSK